MPRPLNEQEVQIVVSALRSHKDMLAECIRDRSLSGEERLAFVEDRLRTDVLISRYQKVLEDNE